MYQDYETLRLNALYNCNLLDTLPDEEFDRITKLATLVFNVPISTISLIDDKRQWFKSTCNLQINETPRELAFCNYTIQQTGILEIEDTTKDERLNTHPWVVEEPKIRYYAGYPLTDRKGYPIGSFCIVDIIPRKLTPDQRQAFALLGESVSDLIKNYK